MNSEGEGAEAEVGEHRHRSDAAPWANPYFRFIEFTDDARRLLTLHHAGMHNVIARQTILKILAGLPTEGYPEGIGEPPAPESEKVLRIERMQPEVDAAQRELDTGHSLLQAHLLVGVWGAFEAFVEDFAVLWLLHHPELLTRGAPARIKVVLSEYYSIESEEDRMRVVVNELRRNSGSDLKRGIGQFEALLSAIECDGPVDRRLRDTIFVAQQVRHVMAHRAGVADRKLVDACPTEGFVIGEPVTVTQTMYSRWVNALLCYGLVIIARTMSADQRRALRSHKTTTQEFTGFMAASFPDTPEFAERTGTPTESEDE